MSTATNASSPLLLVGKQTDNLMSLSRDLGLVGRHSCLQTRKSWESWRERRRRVLTLNERSFKSLQPRLGRDTPLLLESGFSFGRRHQDVLKAIRESDTPVVVEDCKVGDLEGLAAVSPEGKCVALKSSYGGRRQELFVINEVKLSQDFLVVDSVVENPDPQAAMEVKEEFEEQDFDSVVESPDLQASPPPMEVKEEFEEEEWGDQLDFGPFPPSTRSAEYKRVLLELSRFLTHDSKQPVLTPNEVPSSPPSLWESHTTLRLHGYSKFELQYEHAPKWIKKRFSRMTTTLKPFCTIHISQFASENPRSKWVRFRLTDAAGMFAKMGMDSSRARGFFNHSATIRIFPGGSEAEPGTSSFSAAGWSRPHAEPHTPNSETTYVSTTGWEIGAKAVTTTKGESSMEISATYNQSKQVTRTMKDFSVRNVSDESMTGWTFYYTAVDKEKWKNHFKLEQRSQGYCRPRQEHALPQCRGSVSGASRKQPKDPLECRAPVQVGCPVWDLIQEASVLSGRHAQEQHSHRHWPSTHPTLTSYSLAARGPNIKEPCILW